MHHFTIAMTATCSPRMIICGTCLSHNSVFLLCLTTLSTDAPTVSERLDAFSSTFNFSMNSSSKEGFPCRLLVKTSSTSTRATFQCLSKATKKPVQLPRIETAPLSNTLTLMRSNAHLANAAMGPP